MNVKKNNKTDISVNPNYYFFDYSQNPCEEPSLAQL